MTNGFLSTAAAFAPGAEEQASTPQPVPDDNALMQRLQEGDEAALGVLLDRYASLVFGIGFKVLRDREEAEELVQELKRESQPRHTAAGTKEVNPEILKRGSLQREAR